MKEPEDFNDDERDDEEFGDTDGSDSMNGEGANEFPELQDIQSEEDLNDIIMKQCAVSFVEDSSMSDVKYLIQRKISHNKNNFGYLVQIIDTLNKSPSQEARSLVGSEEGPVKSLMCHICSEIIKTDDIINRAIEKSLNKTEDLKDFKENS